MQVTTRNDASSYTALCWITGAPIGTDADPTNLASVAAGRRITYPKGIFLTSSTSLCAFGIGGASSCVVRFWWYDSALDLWVPNGNVGTLTSASTSSLIQGVGCMPGSQFFCQVVSNAGGTTSIAFLIR